MMAQPDNYSFATLEDHTGHDFGASDDILVDQERINNFAETTNDMQWIHTDVEKAKKFSPFGGTVAHGFLTLSLVAGAMGASGVVPKDSKAVFNYGVEKVRFLAPVPAGATVRARFVLKSVEAKSADRKLITAACTVEIEGSEKPALVGEFMALVVA